MNDDKTTFPIYRKYSGINVWFKIIAADEFLEVRQVGANLISTRVNTGQHPERVLIRDMIVCHEGRWEEVDASEVEEKLRNAKSN